MPRFAANLSLLFTEVPLLDRFAAARAAGFAAVEMQFPYAEPKEVLAARRAEAGLPLVLHNLPPGDWAAGERGIAILPERVPEFREGVARATDYAGALGCRQINCLAGLAPSGAERTRLLGTLTENLAYAADALGKAGIRLLLEPINDRDMPGFFLNRLADAASVIEAVGSENLFIQADLYHMARMGEDLATELAAHRDRIAHVQIADAPGRHEPGTGSIDFPAAFATLDRLGYDGFIGCEYGPAAGTAAGLGWMTAFR
ncbi:hydroxypyruvate isomerase [Methylorubrum populi]|jgi:hydroxypyruvate isomerase|uniref:Hydroxypyruvate isomerase n=1 Tax=Methylorubrum rhodesianum TaxID=29427 RepID=A0ABU9ZJ71_9HYPH|nr:hydroxypyruvate isomerase [Methylorubrum rhodesianum]MBK3401876.1 hydroxypyruvate isomerase [Methylorubrum rhodesianum]MBY0141132.1 hydroxypyruvate isomerase [Methylorubrum populi]